MRVRVLSVLAGSLMLLSVIGAASAAAGASPSAAARATGKASGKGFAPSLTILVNQIGSPGASSVLSQDFTDAGFDPYDSYLADDFNVPGSLTLGWQVKGMRSVGVFFNGPGPCASVSVNFYKDAAGLPGAQQGTTQTGSGSPTGTHTLVFGTPQLLPKGFSYWASMWCTMAFSPGGEWGWTTRTVQAGNKAKWQNTGGGFGICPTWADMDTCIGLTGQPDLEYALAGGRR